MIGIKRRFNRDVTQPREVVPDKGAHDMQSAVKGQTFGQCCV